MEWGGIFVNGRPQPLAFALPPLVPCRVEYYEPKMETDAQQVEDRRLLRFLAWEEAPIDVPC